MMPLEPAQALRRVPFLRDVDEDALRLAAQALVREEHERGAEISRQGSPAGAIYLIAQGEVELMRAERGAKPRRIAVLHPGDLLGEMEVLQRRPWASSARAVQPVVLLRWDRSSFASFLRRNPAALLALKFAARSKERALQLRFGWLEDGEVVYGLSRKHPVLLYQALTIPILVIAVAVGLALLSFPTESDLAAWLAGGSAGVGLALAAWRWIDWANDYYIVTDRRAVWLEKVIGIYESRQEAPLRMVLSVSSNTELTGRVLDYGDVIIRTYTGRILFRAVAQPRVMVALIEELWRRSQTEDQEAERATIVETLQQRLGPSPAPAAPSRPMAEPPRAPSRVGLDHWTFQVRFEEKGIITYRKHWMVLLRATLLPAVLILLSVGLLGARLGGLFQVTSLAGDLLGAFVLIVPLSLWWLYQYADWANDLYQVTPEQILDIHKKPLASEIRKVAPLENILGTEVDRKGLLGLILNYGDVIANVGTEQFVFQGIYDPSAVQLDIVRSQEALYARKKHAEKDRRREEMVEWLDAYHREIVSRGGRKKSEG
jgi:CRP-like cAMP-binding protein